MSKRVIHIFRRRGTSLILLSPKTLSEVVGDPVAGGREIAERVLRLIAEHYRLDVDEALAGLTWEKEHSGEAPNLLVEGKPILVIVLAEGEIPDL